MARKRVFRILLRAICVAGCLLHSGRAVPAQGATDVTQQRANAEESPALEALTIRIVQDNYPYSDELETAWGFAAWVDGAEKTLLFDTGSDGTLLLANMAKLDLDPNDVETVVISHNHADHTGGLVGLLQRHADLDLYGLESFPARFKQVVRDYGARLVEVKVPVSICAQVRSTGQVGTRIPEQALVVRTQRGLVVITGCAHPGVVRMVERAKAVYEGEDVLLVLGGFHLGWASAAELDQVIAALQGLGVRYVAPTHCSGDKTRARFHERFGNRYLEVGAGKIITLTDLK